VRYECEKKKTTSINAQITLQYKVNNWTNVISFTYQPLAIQYPLLVMLIMCINCRRSLWTEKCCKKSPMY